MTPDFSFEQEAFENGHRVVVGVDEVGRGAFAGPLVVGLTSFDFSNKDFLKRAKKDGIKINDSKKLTEKQRENSARWIKKNSLWSIGKVDVHEINSNDFTKCIHSGFRRAVGEFHTSNKLGVDFLLIDAILVPKIRRVPLSRQNAIIKGDELSFSIAAASVLAKVERDRTMKYLSKKHPEYLWERNKGYGTKDHREALRIYGTTKHHRLEFVKNTLNR